MTSVSNGPIEGASRFKWNPRVATRTLDDTAFVLLQNRMVSLNEVGTFLWGHYKETSSIDDAVDAVVENFETTADEARPDVVEFTRELLNKELLVSVEANG
ncbi:MAG: PqqD family protein [Myxococcota bacterium]|nr:PqqD family protein [Myxococcota bacterium]